MSDLPDQQQILGATRGDTAALEDLLVAYLPRLRAFLRLHSGPVVRGRESVSDLLQSVCGDLLRKADAFEYRGEPQFRRWLFLAAERKIRDRGRFHARERRDAGREVALDPDLTAEGALDAFTPSRVAMGREDAARLEAAFDVLSDEQRRVVTMARLLSMSHAEIGEALGVPAARVRVILHRAVARIAAALARGNSGDARPGPGPGH